MRKKRCFSILLAVLLVTGVIPTIIPKRVQASNTTPVEIKTNYGVYFPSIDLIALNNVATAIQEKDGMTYTGKAKINGTETTVSWTESGNNLILGGGYKQSTVTTIELSAGERFTSTDGATVIVLNHGVSYTKTGTGIGASNWTKVVEVTELETEVTFYRCNESLTAYAFSNAVIKDIPDGTIFSGTLAIDKVKTEINWIKSGNCFVIQGLKDNGTFTRLEVPAGTKLIGSNATNITITNSQSYIKSNGMWVADVKVTELKTGLTFYRCNENLTAYAFDNEKIKTVPDGTIFSGTLMIDKVKTSINWIKSGNCFVIQGLKDDGSFMRLEVPAGTKLIGSNATNVTITNGSKFVKLEGSWMEDYGQTKIEYNDVKISFHSFDGRGFYLKAEIVAGPDKGKIIGTEAYGTWASRSEGSVYCNGTEEMNVNYSPNVDMLYISGNYDLETLTSLVFKKGTVIIPQAGAQKMTYMRLKNTLELEKEPVYGRWGVKGVIKTPTKFNDVSVSVYNVTGVKVVLSPTLASGSTKTLSEVYGQGTVCYGSVVVKDPDAGVYTNDNATFVVSGNQILLVGIQVGLMDSIRINAGTILWPTTESETQIPLRITNNIRLTRNAEDEWVYKVDNNAIKLTSPKSGDDLENVANALLIVLAGMSICVCYAKRRRKGQI